LTIDGGGRDITKSKVCLCVYYCSTYYKAVRVGEGGCGMVCVFITLQGVSSLHSGIEFGRSRTGKGSSGGEKKGVV